MQIQARVEIAMYCSLWERRQIRSMKGRCKFDQIGGSADRSSRLARLLAVTVIV